MPYQTISHQWTIFVARASLVYLHVRHKHCTNMRMQNIMLTNTDFKQDKQNYNLVFIWIFGKNQKQQYWSNAFSCEISLQSCFEFTMLLSRFYPLWTWPNKSLQFAIKWLSVCNKLLPVCYHGNKAIIHVVTKWQVCLTEWFQQFVEKQVNKGMKVRFRNTEPSK